MRNLFDEKLKHAKQELTNLKTAHQRGLGALKIYSQTLQLSTVPDIHGRFTILSITVQTSREFAPRPLMYALGDIIISPTSGMPYASFNAKEINLSSDGYSTTFEGDYWFEPEYGLTKVVVFSTTPIVSITGEMKEPM